MRLESIYSHEFLMLTPFWTARGLSREERNTTLQRQFARQRNSFSGFLRCRSGYM